MESKRHLGAELLTGQVFKELKVIVSIAFGPVTADVLIIDR
jgi:hypothetical protein